MTGQVLAFRSLKAEDEILVRGFLEKVIMREEGGVAYAIADAKGTVVAAGKILDTQENIQERTIRIARLRAAAVVAFRGYIKDRKPSTTGYEIVDGMFADGGILLIANDAVCGAIGIAGRPKPKETFPGKMLWDHEIAHVVGEHLKEKLGLENPH